MPKHRLQLDFSEDALQQLDALKESTGASNRAELIRQALQLFYWTVVETRDNNATLLLEKEGKLREVVFPFWAGRKTQRAASN